MNPDYQPQSEQPVPPQQSPEPVYTQPAPLPNYAPAAALPITETSILKISRHPIGIFSIYFLSGFIIVALALIVFGVLPRVFSDNKSLVLGIGSMLLIVIAILCGIYSLIATKIYWGNTWELSTEGITQVSRTGLFDKQSSQLSLGDIEDVTVEQNGMLTHMLNYGLIRVETAGEHSKFVFLYCPNPNYYSQSIIAAREDYDHRTGNKAA